MSIAVLRLILDGHAVSVTARAEGDYLWRVDDPATSDWARGRAPDALSALRAASLASFRLPAQQQAIRGASRLDSREVGSW